MTVVLQPRLKRLAARMKAGDRCVVLMESGCRNRRASAVSVLIHGAVAGTAVPPCAMSSGVAARLRKKCTAAHGLGAGASDLGSMNDSALSAMAVMVSDGFTPGFDDTAAPSITYRPS